MIIANSGCVAKVYITDGSAHGSWFGIWAGAVAVDTICVGHGQAGVAYRLGESNVQVLRFDGLWLAFLDYHALIQI